MRPQLVDGNVPHDTVHLSCWHEHTTDLFNQLLKLYGSVCLGSDLLYENLFLHDGV